MADGNLVYRENSRVLGVKEYQVVKHLLGGEKELIEALVESQWGPVHLFDLCLWYGHIDTALALARGNVKGCKLETYHLEATIDAALDPRHRNWPPKDSQCNCRWSRCQLCCWGFPLDQGIWMKDWDVSRLCATFKAQTAAKTQLIKVILEMFTSNQRPPFDISQEAAVQLLDIAILSGNAPAARQLAHYCGNHRPLRKWRGDEWLTGLRRQEAVPTFDVLHAALCVGADFQNLEVEPHCHKVPFLRAAALYFSPGQFALVQQFFQEPWPTWWPVNVGDLLFKSRIEHGNLYFSLSELKVRNALRAKWDLNYIQTRLQAPNLHYCCASVLDLALLCGHHPCAKVLAGAGVELSHEMIRWHQWLAHGAVDQPRRFVMFECDTVLWDLASSKDALTIHLVAATAFLQESYRREAVKGLVVYQMMAKHFQPKKVAMEFVHEILQYSMERPKLLDQLNFPKHLVQHLFSDWFPQNNAEWLDDIGSKGGPQSEDVQ